MSPGQTRRQGRARPSRQPARRTASTLPAVSQAARRGVPTGVCGTQALHGPSLELLGPGRGVAGEKPKKRTPQFRDRKRVGYGQSVSVRVYLGGCSCNNKKKQ